MLKYLLIITFVYHPDLNEPVSSVIYPPTPFLSLTACEAELMEMLTRHDRIVRNYAEALVVVKERDQVTTYSQCLEFSERR